MTGRSRIEPMTKFPVVRDLFVDRQRMFDNLTKLKGWVPIDGTSTRSGPGPKEVARRSRKSATPSPAA